MLETENSHTFKNFGQFMSSDIAKRRYAGFVYVFENKDTKMVKIGRSADPQKRISGIRTIGGLEIGRVYISKQIEYKSTCVAETASHKCLENFRFSGEWFTCKFEDAVKVVDATTLQFETMTDEIEEMHRLAGERFAGKLTKLLESWHEEARQKREVGVDKTILNLLPEVINVTSKILDVLTTAEDMDDIPMDVLSLIGLQQTKLLVRAATGLDEALTTCVEKFDIQTSDMVTTMLLEGKEEGYPVGCTREDFGRFFRKNNLLDRLSEDDMKMLWLN